MDLKEYISSGVLEAYILGSLSKEEEALVEANIVKFPELADELLAIETAMQQFSATLSKEPPKGMEDKIWDAIRTNTEADAGKEQQGSGDGMARTIPLQPEYRKQAQWKYAAIWVALIGSLVLNAILWSQSNDRNKDQLALNETMSKLQTDQRQLALLLGDYQKAKGMMADTGMQTIVMHTIQAGHPMAATLYWSKAKGEAYVSVDGLPAPPQGMQYQLWAIQDGKPVDMGVLPNEMANTPAMHKVGRPVMGGQAFAISLEKMGGSPTPTAQNIYVMGKV